MPTPSASAQTQFSLLGLFTRRYGSFAGKTPAAFLIVAVRAGVATLTHTREGIGSLTLTRAGVATLQHARGGVAALTRTRSGVASTTRTREGIIP